MTNTYMPASRFPWLSVNLAAAVTVAFALAQNVSPPRPAPFVLVDGGCDGCGSSGGSGGNGGAVGAAVGGVAGAVAGEAVGGIAGGMVGGMAGEAAGYGVGSNCSCDTSDNNGGPMSGGPGSGDSF